MTASAVSQVVVRVGVVAAQVQAVAASVSAVGRTEAPIEVQQPPE